MGILIGFAPFILFSLLTNLSVSLALWAGFAAAFVITIRDFSKSPSLRALDIASTGLMGTLALYTGFVQPGISVEAVRFLVDAGLFLIAAGSLVRSTPFTIDYARETAREETWNTPQFLSANQALSAIWAGALAAMTAADALATFNHHVPGSLAVAWGLAALGTAIVFTARNPALHAMRGERVTRFPLGRR